VDAEPREHRHAGRLDEEAGADGAGVVHALEDLDVVALPGEEERRGGAAGAEADDGDLHERARAGRMCVG
jgi:hypothetical protein